MKKAMIKIMLVGAALAFAAGTSWGAACNSSWQTGDGVTITDAGGGGTIGVTLSPNVTVYYKPDGATGASYAASSYNSKGTKQYGVASDNQGIKYKDIGSTPATGRVDPSTASVGAFTTAGGWYDVGK